MTRSAQQSADTSGLSMHRFLLSLLILLLSVGCASTETVDDVAEQTVEPVEPVEPELVAEETDPIEPVENEEEGEEGGLLTPSELNETIRESLSDELPVSGASEERIEKAQRDVYDLVKGTATKIDSFFGTGENDTEATVSRGRVSVGGQYDERNGFKDRIRFKAKVRLPAWERRTQLTIGRGNSEDAVDGSNNSNIDTLPSRFRDLDDDEWLFGIGYSRDQKLSRGWKFDIGARFRFPLEPYVRATYRFNKGIGDSWLLKVFPRVYWQEGRGNGASIEGFLDYSPFDDWLFRSYSIALQDDRTEGIRWTTKLFTYHTLSRKSAFSLGVFANGETEGEVELQEYGFEFRHRRKISRKHLYMELYTYGSWPSYTLDETRKFNPGIGIEFELQFGDWPGRSKQSAGTNTANE